MKTLIILRHAKSSWKQEGLSDHDRPLNRRGKQTAPRIGEHLDAEGWSPHIIFSSTARRARSTARKVKAAAGWECPVEFCQQLYLASPADYLEVLATQADPAECAMVVGHNPGLEQLLSLATGCDEPLPTGAAAIVQFDLDSWSELGQQPQGKLLHLWRPREA